MNQPDNANLQPAMEQTRRIKIFAHRGASGYVPENTLLALALAAGMQVDGLEVDVQQLAGELVVAHDADLRRWGGPRRSLYSLGFERVRAFEFAHHQKIPLLGEVLQFVSEIPRIVLNIEIKDKSAFTPAGRLILERFADLVVEGRILVSSFFLTALADFHRQFSQIPIGCLTARRFRYGLKQARKMGAVSWHIPADCCQAEWVQAAQQMGLKVYVYTVNRPAALEQVLRAGVDGLFTDYPDYLLYWLNKISQSSAQ